MAVFNGGVLVTQIYAQIMCQGVTDPEVVADPVFLLPYHSAVVFFLVDIELEAGHVCRGEEAE